MDEIAKGIGASLATMGPTYVFVLGVIIIAAWLVKEIAPSISEYKKGQLQIDEKREQRKCQELQAREESDKRNAEMSGRWLQVTESCTTAVEGLKVAIDEMRSEQKIMVSLWQDSKKHNEQLDEKIDGIYDVTVKLAQK